MLPAVQVRNTMEMLVKSGAIDGDLAKAWQRKLADEMKVKERREMAEAGDGHAMYELGFWYENGTHGLAVDKMQARAWYERSAAVRDPGGLASFGFCLLHGLGGPTDNALGLMNMTDAAHLGTYQSEPLDPEDFNTGYIGPFLLGKTFAKGSFGLSKDPVRARFWLEKVTAGAYEELDGLLQELEQ